MNIDLEKMEDGKEKELMKIISEGGKPFVKKCDGYAVKCSDEKTIEYEDHGGGKLTLSVPAGSYVVVDADSNYPKIVPGEEFEKKNKLVEGDKKKDNPEKKEKKKTGMDAVNDDY
jgi:hypothetical protein